MTAADVFLRRLDHLIDCGLTLRPLALRALADAIEAHNEDGSLTLLGEAVELFHCGSLARSVGQHDTALAEIEAGTAKLREFCGVSP